MSTLWNEFSKKSLILKHQRDVGHHTTYECEICGKKFGRKDNLDRHMGRHKDESLYQCKECGILFSRNDSLQLHMRRYHNQVGRGLKRKGDNVNETPVKRRLTKKDSPDRFYDLRVVTERNIPKFRTKSTTYKVIFKELEVRDLPKILKTLGLLFKSLIKDLTEFMKPEDLVRMSVQCPELDFPITIPFMKVAQLSTETLLKEIEQFVLDSSLEIEITHVNMPSSAGRKHKYVNLDRFLSEKQCIIRIQNRDELCCARALVTAKARLNKTENWDGIRKGYKIQEQMARTLHHQANVPIRKCGIDDVKLFQKVMKDVQINVVSKEHFNGIIYGGQEAESKIYLYHHDEHYDVITSMPAFLNRSYYCHSCHKGYQHREQHRCNNVCSSCHKIHEGSEEDWIYCADCNRYFKGTNCYELHKKSTKNGASTCKSYYRCKQCNQTVNKKMHKKDHKCGKVYCKTCKDYFDDEHLCYMLPVVDEVKQSKSDSKENKNNNEIPAYIFFDFECTQDDLIQCESGYQREQNGLKCVNCGKSNCGTYEHRPYLCVVHKVCLNCYDKEVAPNSTCEHCGQNEMVFAGSNTTDNFCKWLFSGRNNGATVLCHNFKDTTRFRYYNICSIMQSSQVVQKTCSLKSRHVIFA